MESNRPTPIIREDKEQFKPVALPVEKKWTYSDANEDRDKINAAINFLPILIKSDSSGLITGYTYNVMDGATVNIVNILTNKHIGAIIQLGSGVSYAEYDPTLAEGSDMFSKDLDEVQIMQANTHTPMVFAADTLHMLIPR